jgi:hypothetical protein
MCFELLPWYSELHRNSLVCSCGEQARPCTAVEHAAVCCVKAPDSYPDLAIAFYTGIKVLCKLNVAHAVQEWAEGALLFSRRTIPRE